MAALATAARVHRLLGGTDANTELHSVTEFEVMKATRRKRQTERCVGGLQINYRYMLRGAFPHWSRSEGPDHRWTGRRARAGLPILPER
jgi:hypothetical protein